MYCSYISDGFRQNIYIYITVGIYLNHLFSYIFFFQLFILVIVFFLSPAETRLMGLFRSKSEHCKYFQKDY